VKETGAPQAILSCKARFKITVKSSWSPLRSDKEPIARSENGTELVHTLTSVISPSESLKVVRRVENLYHLIKSKKWSANSRSKRKLQSSDLSDSRKSMRRSKSYKRKKKRLVKIYKSSKNVEDVTWTLKRPNSMNTRSIGHLR
jgi:hypothetical protein